MSIKSCFKRITCLHRWERYDVLVPQLIVGGFYAWQKCPKCKKIKFDKADSNTPQQPGWEQRQNWLNEFMNTDLSGVKHE